MMQTQKDAHLAPWLAHRFGLTVKQDGNYEFHCWEGDYDLDCATAEGKTIFAAALEFASCYSGMMFDELVAIELGA